MAVPPAATSPVIDGHLTPGEWTGAARFTLDHQVEPGDNAAASEVTDVWLTFGATHLYVAVDARDRDPGGIRARVGRRDDIGDDDRVTVYLDTHDDRRRAYVFAFNPLGIQADGLYNEGTGTGRDWSRNVDLEWDTVFESAGRVTGDGWVVEAAIPYRSFRYQAGPERRWGLHVERWIARKAEKTSWQPISRDRASLLAQMGAISGLDGLPRGRSLELLPSLVGAVTTTPERDGWQHARSLDPGITALASITPTMTFSAALNPDFSQVEADVPQIEVNQRFPLSYPEKRPFFLEGDQYFRSPGALTFVDTRQVVSPAWGAKLTGKTGRHSIGLMAAADRAPGEREPPGSARRRRDTYFTAGRYQRDLLDQSVVGLFVLDRRFADESTSSVAVDGQIRRETSTLGLQLAATRTAGAPGGSSRGGASYVWYDFAGRHWRVFVNDLRIGADYRAPVGFLRRTGITTNSMTLGYQMQPAASTWWTGMRPFVVSRWTRTDAGLTDESFVDPGVDLWLARDVRVYAYHSFTRDAFLGREWSYQRSVVNYTVNTFERVTLDGRLVVGEAVNFDPAAAMVGRTLDSRVAITVKPDERLSVELLHLGSRLTARDEGRRLFSQSVRRVRVNLQATRDHGLRAILDENTLMQRRTFSLLYSYTPRPNTALYLGYGDLFAADVPLHGEDRDTRWAREQRTLFVKLAIGWRPDASSRELRAVSLEPASLRSGPSS
jgi:hypothetical protein